MPPLPPRPARLVVVTLLTLPVCGVAQAATALDCLPPVPPTPVQDAALRAEYQRETGSEYADYFDAAQTYLHCLEAARSSVTDEINRVIADYQSQGLGGSE